MSRKRLITHRPKPLKCCDKLAKKLGTTKTKCFEDGPTSGGESGTGMRVVFRYKADSQPGMCRLDLRCFLYDWKDNQCDFLFYQCTKNAMYFVELKKPQTWDDAFHQIVNTIKHFEKSAEWNTEKKSITGIIIARNNPPNANQKLRDLEFNFKRAGYKAFFKINNGEQILLE